MATELTCRICQTTNRSFDTGLRTCEDIRHLGTYAVYFCEACGNGFTTPDIPPSHYKLLPDVADDELTPSAGALLRWFIGRRVKKLESLTQIRNASLLDIGGGACAFANAAARRGFNVTVIEPNEMNRKFADTSHGVKFIAEMFSKKLIEQGLLVPNSFDAVTMWHSLEHTSAPRESLQAVQKVLKPGGTLFVSVPNLNGLLAVVGGNYWTYLDVPHHLCHFTPKGLARLVEDVGLRLQRTYRGSIEYDPFGWYQTLLNLLGRSHNYFYNIRKKRRIDEQYVRHPRWTKFVTAAGPLLLPVAAIATMTTMSINSPACVEIAARKELR